MIQVVEPPPKCRECKSEDNYLRTVAGVTNRVCRACGREATESTVTVAVSDSLNKIVFAPPYWTRSEEF